MVTDLDFLRFIHESLGVFGVIGFGGAFILLTNDKIRDFIFSVIRRKKMPVGDPLSYYKMLR